MAVHKHVIYGLGVHSEIPLWGEGVPDCPGDVFISWDASRNACDACAERNGSDDGDLIRLAWPAICELSIRSGREIAVRSGTDSEATHLCHLVTGIGLGLALYQRGVFTLHAGAVSIGGLAVAIAGSKGAGKSTLVAALNARGHPLLSDDVVALDLPDDELPRVRVGAPNMNLWPDSAIATGHDPATLSQIWSLSPKLAGCVAIGQRHVPVPLGAIVVLSGNGSSSQLQRLTPLEAFPQLVGHSHAFRWIEKPSHLPRHLAQCRTVLAQVPVFRLERGESLESLSTFAQQVEEGVARAWAERSALQRVPASSA